MNKILLVFSILLLTAFLTSPLDAQVTSTIKVTCPDGDIYTCEEITLPDGVIRRIPKGSGEVTIEKEIR